MSMRKRRFGTVFVVSNVLLVGVLAAIVTSGMAVAVPTAGVGGFTVEFDQLNATGFTQYATIENNTGCDAYPSAVAQMDSGTISGLHLYKDVQIPEGVPGGGETIRVSIKSSEEVEFTGLTQKFTYLRGDLVFDNGQRITQEPIGEPRDLFNINSPSITINDGEINAQSQFVESITLNGATVDTAVNPNDTASFPEAPCASGS